MNKWHTRDLKTNAKINLKRYYWWAVLACIILSLVSGGGSGFGSGFSGFNRGFNSGYNSQYSDYDDDDSYYNDDEDRDDDSVSDYEFGFTEGYTSGYNSGSRGHQMMSDDEMKSYLEYNGVKDDTSTKEDFYDGYVDGYKDGYFDGYSGAESDPVPDVNEKPAISETDRNVDGIVERIEDAKSLPELKEALHDLFAYMDQEFSGSGLNLTALIVGMLIVFLIVFVIALAFAILVTSPVIVGVNRFFQSARVGNVKFSEVGYAFKKGRYGNIIKVMFFRTLYIWLWSLLFYIPGIIKTYSYMLVPYILSENPKMETKKAIDLSRKLMDGEKWHFFILQLSFILWRLLGILCCGLGMVFINPYIQATYSEFYALMRQKAFALGYATEEDLPGYAFEQTPPANGGYGQSAYGVPNNFNTQNTYNTGNSYNAPNAYYPGNNTTNSYVPPTVQQPGQLPPQPGNTENQQGGEENYNPYYDDGE